MAELILGFDSCIDIEFVGEDVPADARFVAHVRHYRSGPLVGLLSSADDTIAMVEPRLMRLSFPAAMTQAWEQAAVVIDVARIDTEDDQHMGVILSAVFEMPVTRLWEDPQ